jgi:hypothetical protein
MKKTMLLSKEIDQLGNALKKGLTKIGLTNDVFFEMMDRNK